MNLEHIINTGKSKRNVHSLKKKKDTFSCCSERGYWGGKFFSICSFIDKDDSLPSLLSRGRL